MIESLFILIRNREGERQVKLIVQSLLLLLLANVLPGFEIEGFVTALLVIILFTVLNATLGLILKFFSLPLTILTFGLFNFVINGALLKLTALFIKGFNVTFTAAFVAAIVLAVVQGLLDWWTR